MWDKQETAELVEAGAAKAEFIRDGDAKDSLLGTICFSTNASVHPFKASPYLKAKSIDRTCLRFDSFDFHPAVEGLFLQAFGHSELTCSESQSPRPRHTRIRISTAFIIILSTHRFLKFLKFLSSANHRHIGPVLLSKEMSWMQISTTHSSSNLWLISAESAL